MMVPQVGGIDIRRLQSTKPPCANRRLGVRLNSLNSLGCDMGFNHRNYNELIKKVSGGPGESVRGSG
jgi:hypothetical protein